MKKLEGILQSVVEDWKFFWIKIKKISTFYKFSSENLA